jgi:hypothetical protein
MKTIQYAGMDVHNVERKDSTPLFQGQAEKDLVARWGGYFLEVGDL